MHRLDYPLPRTLLTTGLLLLVIFIARCDSGSNDPPDENGNGNQEPGVVSKDIGPEGGTVTSDDGRLTLTFPDGALSGTETITIEAITADDLGPEFDEIADVLGVDEAYELGPDGLSFDAPITVRFTSNQPLVQEDESLSLGAEFLFTAGDGTVEALDSLRTSVDPADDEVVVSGRLSHFSPLVTSQANNGVSFFVTNVPEQLEVDAVFEADVVIAGSMAGSLAEVVTVDGPARYGDESSPPIAPTFSPTSADVPSTGDDRFEASFPYTCTDTGLGVYGSDLSVHVTFDLDSGSIAAESFADFVTTIECVEGGDGGGDGGDEVALILPLPDGSGPPVEMGYPSAVFPDVSVPFGADPPETLFALFTPGRNAIAYNEKLEREDSFFLDGDYTFASGALGHPATERDALLIGGAGGAMAVQGVLGGFARTNTPLADGNVTDIATTDLDDDGVADVAAVTEFTNGRVSFVRSNASGVFEVDDTDSGAINNDLTDGEAIVSTWLPGIGWDAPGDVAYVLTNPDPTTNEQNGSLWACTRIEEGDAVTADCQRAAEVGRNPLRVRGADPDTDGNTVLGVTSWDDQTFDLFRGNIFNTNLTRIDRIEDAQGVTAAITRMEDDVLFAVPDLDDNMIIQGVVNPDDTVETQRAEAPSGPPANDPQGDPVTCGGLEHLSYAARLHVLVGTCIESPMGVSALVEFALWHR